MPIVSEGLLYGQSFRFLDDDTAARLGTLQGRARGRPDRLIEYDRVADYWGRDSGQPRPEQFRPYPHRVLSGPQAASKPSRKATSPTARNSPRASGRPAYDFPALTAGKVVKREFPGREDAGHAGHRASTSGASIFATRACGRRSPSASTSNGRGATLFYGSYERSQSCFEKSDFQAPKACRRRRNWPCSSRSAAKLPAEVFGEAVTQPVSDGSGRDRKLLGEASKLACRRPAGSATGNFVVNDKGERLSARNPGRRRRLRSGLFALGREYEGDRHRCLDPAGRFGAISAAAERFRFRPDRRPHSSFAATPTRDDLEMLFHSRTANTAGSRNCPGTQSRPSTR